MTTPHRAMVKCIYCDEWTPAEDGFLQWVRMHPRLDSVREGIVRFDLDILMHRYMFRPDPLGDRTIQAIMFIEAKTWGAQPSESQNDTLGMMSQLLRNRRSNIHRPVIHHQVGGCTWLYSAAKKEWVATFLLGGHLLRMEYGTPETGWIEWDAKRISINQLVKILAFEMDPDTLRPMDIRRRSGAYTKQQWIDFDGNTHNGFFAPKPLITGE